jgi:Ca2+-dependent lipid-binding protein
VAFINPPTLTLRYTDAGAIANFGFIDAQIRGILQSIMASMLVLPNRFLVKLDVTNDWFKTYQPPLGIIRFTIESATNIGEDKGKKGFFKKLIHDVPDSYATVTLGEKFKTKSTENTRDPKWDETHDFLLSDHDQKIFVEIWDSDTTSDDLMGAASVAVRDILLQGGTHVLALVHGGNEVEGRVKVHGKFHEFVADPASLSSQEPGTHGLLTILIAGVKNIKGDRTKLKPSVAVKWGAAAFRTSIQSDSPGTDVQNPNYDVAFTVPLTSSVTVSGSEPLRITLMDGETEVGSAQVSLDTVLAAPDLTFSKFHVLEDGATIRAAVIIRGTKLVQ